MFILDNNKTACHNLAQGSDASRHGKASAGESYLGTRLAMISGGGRTVILLLVDAEQILLFSTAVSLFLLLLGE